MINKYKPITMNSNKVISCEEGFYKLNTDNMTLLVPKPSSSGRGTWAPIRYKYDEEKALPLKFQTKVVFSYGISKYDVDSPNKMSLCMQDRNLRDKDKDTLTEDELLDIQMEDMTIKMLEDITEKVKKLLLQEDFIKAIGKRMNDKKWEKVVNDIEIVKRKELANGSESVHVYAKVIDTDNFMKTNFFEINDDLEDGLKSVDAKETIAKLSQTNCNCKVIAMLTVDSVFIGTAPYLQVKLSEAVITEYINIKQKNNIVLPSRIRNRSNKTVITNDSDSEDETGILRKKLIDM